MIFAQVSCVASMAVTRLAGDALGVLLELLAEALAEGDPLGDGRLRPALVGAKGAGDQAFHFVIAEEPARRPSRRCTDCRCGACPCGSSGCGLRAARANPIRRNLSMLKPRVFCGDIPPPWSRGIATSWWKGRSGLGRRRSPAPW